MFIILVVLTLRDNLTMARDLLKIIGKPESLISHVPDRPGHDRRYALNSGKIRVSSAGNR